MPGDEPQDGPSRRRSPVAAVIAALVVLAIAASLIVSVPGAFGGQDDAGADVTVPDPAAPRQDQPGGYLSQQTEDGIRVAIEDSTAGSAGVMVIDPGSHDVLFSDGEAEALVPASNQKILTHFSLLAHTGPDQRLATTAVAGQSPNEVVLVAGGDTLLAPGDGDPEAVTGRAGIADLAESTAQAMAGEVDPEKPVRVAVDTSIFSGPSLNPAWEDGDIESQEIGPISPMAFGSHQVPGKEGVYDEDPVASVAEAFERELGSQLEEQVGQEVRVESAGEQDTSADPLLPSEQQEGVTELGRVESATVQEQAGRMMGESDNRLAEVLGRVAARSAGHDGSIEGAQQAAREAVLETLPEEEASKADGLRIVDASGMTMDDRVSADVLGRLLLTAAADDSGRFAPMIEAFPVGGATGTLAERFDDPDESEARGVTRAKTGTLNVVTALSGQTIRADGSPAVVVVLFDDVEDTDAARDAADRIHAIVAADGS